MSKSSSKKDVIMKSIINNIRNCSLNCYKDRYVNDLSTRGIPKDKLLAAEPMIDKWKKQEILFISQAPSKQAFADNTLNSEKNEFLMKFLLKKLWGNKTDSFKIWKSSVFWVHYSNCYPFVYTDGKKKNRDRPPNSRCSKKYLQEIITTMKPEIIIVMGCIAARFFSKLLKREIKYSGYYPSLEIVLEYQMKNKCGFKLDSFGNNNKAPRLIVIPHAANWGSGNKDHEKYAFKIASKNIFKISNNKSK